jgi:hypothetical protein
VGTGSAYAGAAQAAAANKPANITANPNAPKRFTRIMIGFCTAIT